MTTLNELYEQIGEMLEQEDFDGNREVLGIHQPSWPLQESIAGVIDPDDQHERCRVPGAETCLFCKDRLGTGEDSLKHVDGWAMVNDEGDFDGYAHLACKDEADGEKGTTPVYLVLGGAPNGRSPYGPNVWAMDL